MTPNPTPRTIPTAPAAGQLELEEPMTDTTTDAARLHAAAERALDSLEDLCTTTTDPGVEALGARYELATALGRVGKNEMPLDELGFSRDPQVIRQAALYEAAKRLEEDDHLAAAAELREMAGELTHVAEKKPPMDPVHIRGICADEPTSAASAQSADRVVAYRIDHRPSSLLCREHAEDWAGLTPVTSEDLPDGGICTWHDCGRDVLAEPEMCDRGVVCTPVTRCADHA